MLIFIDESGNFTVPNQKHRVSCVSALVVPEAFASKFFRRFRDLTRDWGDDDCEIKGSQLDESKIAAVINLVKKFDVLFMSVGVDMGMHTDVEITAHKNAQAAGIAKAVTDEMNLRLKSQIQGWDERIRTLSNQLFVQSTLLNAIVDRVLRLATLYYVQRIPATLGQFKWIIDAKDIAVTPYEKLWHELVMPAMQSSSVKDPTVQIEGADYSQFAKFCKVLPKTPEYLKGHVTENDEPFLAISLNKILANNVMFADSRRFTGLQIVDILSSALTRACNGNLQKCGWENLGRLMVQDRFDGHVVKLFTFAGKSSSATVPYARILTSFDKQRKKLIVT